MPENPYSPPKGEVEDYPKQPWSPIKAVLLGLAVDVGGSMLLGLLLGMGYAIVLAASGMQADEIALALADLSPWSWISIFGTLMGCGLSVLGGYVCARVS